jgi:hypothetical protein
MKTDGVVKNMVDTAEAPSSEYRFRIHASTPAPFENRRFALKQALASHA